jgi:lipopolysaccharide export system protein LptA
MARNLILLVSTLTLLVALFVGYLVVVQDPVLDAGAGETIDKLPVDSGAAGEALRLPGVEIPSGGGVSFTIYHRETGQPTQRFECDEWTPVADVKDEVFVMKPRLTLWLPTGMIATISADQGQLKVENLEKVQGRPRAGWLRGNVEIVLDRGRDRQRPPLAERPEDEIRATLEGMDFDFESGELRTDGPIEIISRDFELAGTALDLIWNQAENVIQKLTLQHGDRLVIYSGGRLLPDDDENTKPAGAAASPPAATEKPTQPPQKKPEKAYLCVLPGGVVADEFKGDVAVAGLIADELRMLFEPGGSSQDLTHPSPAGQPVEHSAEPAQSAPASAPAERRGVIVRWGGPLRVEPAPGTAGSQRRRHLEALGDEVTLWKGDDELVCSRLEYYNESKQIWLYPDASGRVEFSRGGQLAGSASSIYMDQNRKVVKLIGDVNFTSGTGAAGGRRQAIQCSLWGELHLADKPRPAAQTTESPLEDWMSAGGLESATFMGAARVDLGERTLSAERIDVTFAQAPQEGSDDAAEESSIEAALEKTVASGDVRLEQRDQSLTGDRLEILFGLTEAGKAYPRQMDAIGSVRIKRGNAWLRGQKVHAEMGPVNAEPGAGGPQFVLRKLDVVGDAAMSDPSRKNRLAARGGKITAEFSGANELQRGTVFGTPQEHALVHGSPYTVRGQRIDLEWDGLHVAGPSWLSFDATRSLQGRQRRRATPVEVTSSQSLDVDLSKNTVHFSGDVVAVNGDESLRADEMTLLLEDAKPTAPSGPRVPGWLDAFAPACSRQAIQACYLVGPQLWRQTQTALAMVQHPGQALAAKTRESGDWLNGRADYNRAIRKEPLRLIANNALVQVESLEPGEKNPVTHSSIAAPRMEVDMVGRRIETQGETNLLVTNRRLPSDAASQPAETLGLPSALITRGPSQTAMSCVQGMTYALGDDGPTRSDSAVFEGSVVFVHRAGREMVHLEQMLPEVQNNPELLANLKSRNTLLTCDRLECGFSVEGAQPGRAAGPLSSRDTRLSWLLASGNAELLDVREVLAKEQVDSTLKGPPEAKQAPRGVKGAPGAVAGVRREPIILTVRAHQFDFDLDQKVTRVRGSAAAEARIYEERPDTGEMNTWVGQELSIDMANRNVRTEHSRGAIRR